MNHFKRMQFVLGAAIMAAVALPADKGFAQDPNGARNPYRLEENWAKLPEGRKWGSTIGVEIDPDGKSLGIIFQTTSPFDTPREMQELIEWTNNELNCKRF